ncbi:MAG: MBL fold metallo-hydrolase [Bacteroidia bacterium]
MYIQQLYTNCLAEAAYYIESQGEAAVIDPIRETEAYLELASDRGATIKYIFETHFHADFVSGHIDLARKTGAQIIYGPGAHTQYDTYTARDGERFRLGKLELELLHTPGHTPESSCYLLYNEQQQPHALFSGDTLFVGDVGRPDLAVKSDLSQNDLAGMLYDSLRNKILPLPDEVILYPAHGAGSSCGKNIGKETFSTIGKQRMSNYALQPMSKTEFITAVTEGLSAPPAYFFEDARINQQGYAPLEEVHQRNLQRLGTAEVQKALEAGVLVLDTRPVLEFEKSFIKGSISIGLDGQFAIWVGTLISIKQPLLVVVNQEQKAHEAITRLARVGYEHVLGYWVFDGRALEQGDLPVDQLQSVHAEEAARQFAAGQALVDVRKPGEWESAHAEGAQHLSLQDLPEQIKKWPQAPALLHCAGGYRSVIAASLLKRHGIHHITNIYGGWGAMQKTGAFPVVETACGQSQV